MSIGVMSSERNKQKGIGMKSEESDVNDFIIGQIETLLMQKNAVHTSVQGSTHILAETELDSLDLATLLVNLEMHFGFDPFREGFIQFQTVSELIALYEG